MDFGIRLDKNTYEAGERVQGTLLTKADKSLKIGKLKFSVHGKERYEASMSGGVSSGGISGEQSHSSKKNDVFFFEDLTSHLKPTFSISQDDDNKIEIPQSSYAIPFHFSIPPNALESYQGKHARIVYEVEVVADMGRWKRDYRHVLPYFYRSSFAFVSDIATNQAQAETGKGIDIFKAIMIIFGVDKSKGDLVSPDFI